MKNTLTVQIVETLSEKIELVQQQIRARAYERYLARNDESQQPLADWLEAERETLMPAILREGESGLIGSVELPENAAKNLTIEATTRHILVSSPTPEPRYALLDLGREFDPQLIKARLLDDGLQLIVPTALRALKETA